LWGVQDLTFGLSLGKRVWVLTKLKEQDEELGFLRLDLSVKEDERAFGQHFVKGT
jgi:hypothetical protein